MKTGILVIVLAASLSALTVQSEMMEKAQAVFQKALSYEDQIKIMHKEAVKENDIRRKICIDDATVTLKGVIASIEAATNRMNDLLSIEKKDSATAQLTLIKGLEQAARKSYNDALVCKRSLNDFNTDTSIEFSENKDLTGTIEEGTIDESMGLTFSDIFLSEQDPLAEDISYDSGGTDEAGGPQNNQDSGETTLPPAVPVSREL